LQPAQTDPNKSNPKGPITDFSRKSRNSWQQFRNFYENGNINGGGYKTTPLLTESPTESGAMKWLAI